MAPVPLENLLNAHHYIELSCVMGASFPQPCAIVQLAEDLRKELKDSPSRKDEITRELENLVESINQKVDHHEALQCIIIAKEPWIIENGFLTPTMKIKRPTIEERYKERLENWYSQKKTVIWEE